jgi:TRAP transporter TAXI family solute receptor
MAKKSLIAVLTAVSLAAFAGPASAQYNLTLCGASPGGLWTLLGAGIDAAVKAAFPGSTVTYQTSGGGLANVGLLDQKKCDLALIHDAEARAATRGLDPFKQPVTSMRTLAVLYTWAPLQVLANRDFVEANGIKTLEDIAAKKIPVRVTLNKRGNIASGISESMLKAAGASVEDIESWGGSVIFAASAEQSEFMQDRRADIMINSLFVNHSSISQLASSIDIALLPLSEATANAVAAEWGIGTYTIPGSAYAWNPQDTLTVTLSAQLFVREDADPQMVKDITQALIQHVDKLQGVHKSMAPLEVKLMASATTVEYHPAAKEVYQAAGL